MEQQEWLTQSYDIRFPEIDRNEEQNAEFCQLKDGGTWRTVRLHDYDEIYRYPGLYEQLFYERLHCSSPRQVVGLLCGVLEHHDSEVSKIRAIDLGAGNGMAAEELQRAGVKTIIGVDILAEARMAAMRDRPDLYNDYVVADLCEFDDATRQQLESARPNLLVTVAALGFGDIPVQAFANAFNLIEHEGWIAFNIRDAFLNHKDRSGFSRLIHEMSAAGVMQVRAWKRYVHRLNIHGKPIEYIAIVARKHGAVSDAMVRAASHPRSTGAATAGAPLIEFQNVSKCYDGRREALAGVSMTIHQGELVALVGGSGSGKTTALKLINRLIDPTHGSIRIEGADVRFDDPVRLRRRIGYVFQQIGLFPHMTVGDNIAITPRLLGWNPSDISQRVDELLTLVGLPPDEFRLRRPRELSGGQQQRIGFARALAARPSIVLLDEPFGAIDPITRESLQREFALIHRQFNLTSVLVTHDMAEALLLADRIAVLNNGALIQLGTPHQLLTSPADDYVASLIDAPRRSAERLEELSRVQATDDLLDSGSKEYVR